MEAPPPVPKKRRYSSCYSEFLIDLMNDQFRITIRFVILAVDECCSCCRRID